MRPGEGDVLPRRSGSAASATSFDVRPAPPGDTFGGIGVRPYWTPATWYRST